MGFPGQPSHVGKGAAALSTSRSGIAALGSLTNDPRRLESWRPNKSTSSLNLKNAVFYFRHLGHVFLHRLLSAAANQTASRQPPSQIRSPTTEATTGSYPWHGCYRRRRRVAGLYLSMPREWDPCEDNDIVASAANAYMCRRAEPNV